MAAASARNSTNVRLYLLAAMLFLWGGAICLRLVYLQIFRYGSFEQRAQHQQQRTMEVSARRGIIYDRAGHELAMSIAVDSVFAVPTEMPDLAGTISLISRITHADPRELLAKCQAARTFCWLARKADAETADRIRSLNLRGIYFQKESKRFYPKRELAAQVIGYVGTDDEGLSGIEREFDDQLRGKPGEMLISVDARRKWFGSVEKQPEPGQNVVLTIDQQIQYIAERELQTAMEQTHADQRHGHGGESAHRRDSGAGQSAHVQSQSDPRNHTGQAEEPCRQRRVRAGFDVQGGDDLRCAGREADHAARSLRLPDGVDRHQRHENSRQPPSRPVCRFRTFSPSRAMSAPSRSACVWATSGSTNTFAASASASRPASNCRARLAA